MRFGLPLPDRIQNAPELNLGLELFYIGFLELTSCRQVGMGIGPITNLSMMDYCDRNGIVGEQREDFLWILPRLDHKYLEWSAARAKSK